MIADVVYGHDYGMAMTFDVYLPNAPNGAGVILINSGGWKSLYDTFKVLDQGRYRFATDDEMSEMDTWHILSQKKLVANGYTVFEVRHGSEPKFVMPEIVAQVRRAVRFIMEHSQEYGVNNARMGLWGGSASGHLALLIGLTPEIALPDASHAGEKDQNRVSAIVVFDAPSDLKRFVTDNPKEIENRPVLRMKPKQYREYSSVTYASKDDPPTLIMHGNVDIAVPIVQGNVMYEALQRAGVESKFIEFPETTHSPTLEQASRGIDEALAWFESHLNN